MGTLEPFLKLASENPTLLVLVEAAGPDILPLLPKLSELIEIAPNALPLLVLGLDLKPITLIVLGLAAFGAAGASVFLIPDDTIVEVAGQTLLAAALADPVAAAKKSVSFI